jgi:ech hydrogenase subunit F
MLFALAGRSLINLFRKPSTRRYPAEPYVPKVAARGSLQIAFDNCNLCTLCAKRCPTGALIVDRVSRYWEIDRMRCIVCGYCVESCPKSCLALSPVYSAPLFGGEKPRARERHARKE